MKHKRTKATSISAEIKRIVWERDHHACIICHSSDAFPEAHYVPRSHGGLGIEQNIVTLCRTCHDAYDNGKDRAYYQRRIEAYLKAQYPHWNREVLIFKKGIQLHKGEPNE